MSLRPDDRSSRNRDRSSTRDRSRSRTNIKTTTIDEYGYDSRNSSSALVRRDDDYEVRSPESVTRSSYNEYRSGGKAPYPDDTARYQEIRPDSYTTDRYERRTRDDDSDSDRTSLAYGAPPKHLSRHSSYDDDRHASYSEERRTVSYSDDRPEERRTVSYSDDRRQNYQPGRYAPQEQYQYAKVPEKITYTSKAYRRDDDDDDRRPDPRRQISSSSYERDTRIVDITPRDDDRYDRQRDRKSSNSEVHRMSVTRTSSNSLVPSGLDTRMNRLSVSGGRPDMHAIGGGLPPASPLLEAYHGTYQSISPMPGAMRMDDDDIDDLPDLDYRTTKTTRIVEKEKKRVKLYDPEADAKTLAKALNSRDVDSQTICEILPPLSDDQIWELRKEYKKQVKIQGKGINLSKHLKMKVSGNFGKVVYVTALGRWESEGYWANFFYQSHASRRELLVESLMGRTNADIRSIKEEFKDKRYNDDLVRCMEKELKMDKFRTAVLMALEGRRQEEQDSYPQEYRDRDVHVLHQSVSAAKGGESAMLEIVIRRSDAHLREILRQYERMHGENFARVALKKSNNLVGEVIAHILNGVINKAARDALLLRHALKDIAAHNKDDELRYELLTSRIVRLHWDRLHMLRVKKEYKQKYGKHLEEDIEDSTKGDFRDFVCELCEIQGAR